MAAFQHAHPYKDQVKTGSLGVLLLSLLVGCRSKGPELLAWAATQDVPAGTSRRLPLPPELEKQSEDRRATVARPDGRRLCVWVKTDIGYKENFEGLLFCDAPLEVGEYVDKPVEPEGAPYISLQGEMDFEELYVRKKIDDKSYEIYFDLN